MKRLFGLFILVGLITTGCYVATETGERDTLRTSLIFPFLLAFLVSLGYLGWSLGELTGIKPERIAPGRELIFLAVAVAATFVSIITLALAPEDSVLIALIGLAIAVAAVGWAIGGVEEARFGNLNPSVFESEITEQGPFRYRLAEWSIRYGGIIAFPAVFLLSWIVFDVTSS
ncbi:MAG: hypothetical protein Q8P03_00310 [bacterium]|nr:hypothetical protein [bacterium]